MHIYIYIKIDKTLTISLAIEFTMLPVAENPL